MGFRKKISDFDMGVTSIENIFINDFMPFADGLYVKVYLIGLKLAEDFENSPEMSNQTIASILGVPLSDVLSAWNYWEKMLLIEKNNIRSQTDYDITFLSLRQIYLNQNYARKDHSKQSVFQATKGDKFYQLFGRIDNVLTLELQPMERLKLIKFLEDFDIAEDLVVKAFELKRKTKNRVENSIKHMNMWLENNIKTLEDLELFSARTSERFRIYKTILKDLGHPFREPAAGEIEIMDQWLDTFEFTPEFILSEIKEITKKNSSVSMNYLNAIFKNKFEGKTYEKDTKQKEVQRTSKNKFHNFSGNLDSKYTNDELKDKIAKRRSKNTGVTRGENE